MRLHRKNTMTFPLLKDPAMSATLFYEDAIDLLDADHKLVQKMFRVCRAC